MASLSSLNFKLTANIAPFRKGLNKAERAMDRMGRKMQQTGKNLSMKLTAPLAAIGAVSFNVFKGFEAEMSKVQAVSGATAEEFKALSDNAKELGASTMFSAREVATLQTEFAKLGFSAQEITKVTEATLALAQASGSDLARSAEVAGSTLRAFGLDASETSRVTDVMAKSFSTSALDMETFANSMKFVAPVANSAGMSIEETSAMLAVLANAGIKGSQAGTSLRRIISEIGATGKPTAEALKDLATQGIGLADAKDEVGRSAQSALLILAEGVDQISPLTKEFENSGGAAKEMADIMGATAFGASKRLESAMEGLGISIGEIVAVAVVPLVEFLAKAASKLNGLSDGAKTTIVVLGAIAAAIGPVIFMVGGLARGLAVLRNATILQTIATTALGVAVNILTSPITLIVGLIAALAAGVIYVAYNFKAFSATARNAIASMINAVIPKVNTLIGAFNSAAEFFGRETIMIKPIQKMEKVAVPAFKSIGQVVTEIKEDLGLFKEETEETADSVETLGDELETTKKSTKKANTALTEYQKTMQRVNAISDRRAKMNAAFGADIDTTDFENFESTEETEEHVEQFENVREGYAKTKLAAMDLADAISQLMQQMAIDTIVGMSEIVGAIAVGEASFADLGNFVIAQFATMLQQLGKLFIEYGVGLLAFQKATFTMNPYLAIAAGAALIAIGSGISAHMKGMAEGNIPALAEGGIVTGPTLALIGEGRESEAVIPLSKLSTMIAGGGQNVVVTGRISGADILLSQERAARTRSRQRGF